MLARAGYEASIVAEAFRLGRFLAPDEVHASLRGRYHSDALEPLVSLLVLNARVPRAAAEAALEPVRIEELEGLGLAESEGPYVCSRVRAIPTDDLLLLGDGGEWDRPDVVSPLYGATSTLLARLTPRGPRRSALDLGTGAGMQALLASRHCERVIGTDVNPRALAYSDLGAQLNGVTNAEWRQGNWLEPVAGERFDLILANLPYVVAPDTEFTFRDSGLPGGELVARLCSELPDHLEEDGLAILLHEWPHATEDSWQLLSEGGLHAAGCDMILVCLGTRDPLDHAVGWNIAPARWLDPTELKRGVGRWHAHTRASGTGAISFGALILRRRRPGRPPWKVEVRSRGYGERAARQLERLIAGNDLLASGEDILERPLAVPEGFSVSQRFIRREQRWLAKAATATVSGELGVAASVDPDALDVLFKCDGAAEPASLAGGDGALRAVVETASRELLANGLIDIR